MENSRFIWLNVKTVQTFDVETGSTHVAYTVSHDAWPRVRFVSAWTLQDAIALFARLYHCDRSSIKVVRPFFSQRLPIAHF